MELFVQRRHLSFSTRTDFTQSAAGASIAVGSGSRRISLRRRCEAEHGYPPRRKPSERHRARKRKTAIASAVKDGSSDDKLSIRATSLIPRGFDRIEPWGTPGGEIAEDDPDQRREAERQQDDRRIDQERHFQRRSRQPRQPQPD